MLYDKDIREPLFDYLEEKFGKIRILEEKKMGKSRADVVMVLPDALCGIEIKSDADTYARLERQVRDYNKYYDYNYIVAGSKHGLHVAEHVPKWWGIITVELENEKVNFYVVREALKNPSVNWKKKMSILWRPELVHIQEMNELPKYRQKSKDFVIDKILLKVAKDCLYEQISNELFERDYNEIEKIITDYKLAMGKRTRRRVRRRR